MLLMLVQIMNVLNNWNGQLKNVINGIRNARKKIQMLDLIVSLIFNFLYPIDIKTNIMINREETCFSLSKENSEKYFISNTIIELH
jgi:hypothetical protein